MVETVAGTVTGDAENFVPETKAQGIGLVWRIAWRNLWRNKRRTWLTAGGIAFASFLVTASMSFQQGSYGAMIDNATGFFLGQIQVGRAEFIEDQKLESVLVDATELVRDVESLDGVTVAPRVQTFALVSVGERSYGGMILGVDFEAEQRVVTFFENISQGRLPASSEEVVVGETMARNLGASVGDEIVILGTAKQGGVAAMAMNISGLFSTGQAELDRTMLFAPIVAVQSGFELGDEVHNLVVRTDDLAQLEVQAEKIREVVPNHYVTRTWPALLPDIVQGIEIDKVTAQIMYGVILVLVSFSVVNTFLMIVFERTREFGMLLAVGMRPASIVIQVLLEALFIWVVGVAVGLVLSSVVVGYLAVEGIPLAGIEEIAAQYHMPDRLYPAFSLGSLVLAPAVLLIGTQLAAIFASTRIYRLKAVEALRAE